MHPGTGTEIVTGIMHNIGIHVDIVRNANQIKAADFDGLILLGGADISPWYYGEKTLYSENTDETRDYTEWLLIRQAMTRNIPIFGICRGHQMITIAHGGSLYQDMRKQLTGDHATQHRVTLAGKLTRYAATDCVNSLHHQAIRRAPDGFKTLAKAPDGVIEAIWKPGVLGVQWHPELMYRSDPRWERLFVWFANGLD